MADGDVRQSMACALSAADRNSASTPGALPVIAKYAKNPGWFQCVMPGHDHALEVREDRVERLALLRARASGSAARMSPGFTRDSTG